MHYNKAFVLDNLGNHIVAIQDYDKVLYIDPKNIALDNKGLAFAQPANFIRSFA